MHIFLSAQLSIEIPNYLCACVHVNLWILVGVIMLYPHKRLIITWQMIVCYRFNKQSWYKTFFIIHWTCIILHCTNYNPGIMPSIRCLANSLLRIFPAGDFGIELTKKTLRIFLYGATCNKQSKRPINP